jgi:Flp pilus assembly protein TadD
MKSTRSIRSILKVTTALGLALVAAGCSELSRYGADSRPTLNLDDQDQRAEFLLRYCNKMHEAGELYTAASMCQRAFESRPTDPAPLYPLAEIYKKLGAIQQAADAYRAAILINPEDFEALYGLAKTSIDLGKYDMAEAQLERALQINDGDPRVYNAMGIVKDQQGQHDVAQALYRTGLLIDPDNVSLRNNLGLSLALTGDQAESVAMLRGVAGEASAGTVGSRNLALAADYNAPADVMVARDAPDGPIEIRTADLDDEDGDELAAAPSKPLRKEGAKVAEMTPRSRSIGSAEVKAQPEPAGSVTARVAPQTPRYVKQDPKPMAKGYKVQVGAFRSQQRAERAWKSVMAASKDLLGGLSHEVVRADLGAEKGVLYRLRAGPLSDRGAGDKLCTDLKGRGLGCFVVELPKTASKPAAKPAAKMDGKPAAGAKDTTKAKPAPGTKPQTKALPAATKKPEPLTSGGKAEQPMPKKTAG